MHLYFQQPRWPIPIMKGVDVNIDGYHCSQNFRNFLTKKFEFFSAENFDHGSLTHFSGLSLPIWIHFILYLSYLFEFSGLNHRHYRQIQLSAVKP